MNNVVSAEIGTGAARIGHAGEWLAKRESMKGSVDDSWRESKIA